jgi:hypothetical protein
MYPIFIVNLPNPFRHLSEHAAVVNLLESFSLTVIAGDLSNQQNNRS